MITDIIEVNNFIILIEQSNAKTSIVQKCEIDGDAVGFAFYSSGNVELEIKHQDKTKIVTNTTGIAISFFGNNKVEFCHKIGPDKPLLLETKNQTHHDLVGLRVSKYIAQLTKNNATLT